ncbi:NAD(+)/NADH kinase [Acetobacterium fimetarium]|uniref:NAD kinase n=1 Tax=Acetobacterium fimetarium TaxID=52691 RepID=A0ABR6WY56_9FIRM|nr:NAD(+)/NADH kinase [Acetobacterium fimetarium]MBC3805527.1 NAD(+)/NADH kinase [Acetobacterium fimetarium]
MRKLVNQEIREIGVYLNMEKKDSKSLAERCIAYLVKRGFKIALLEGQISYQHELVHYYPSSIFYEQPDCILVLGGDGTLLSVARKSCFSCMPIFGINLGKLGFLTEGEAAHYEETLKNLTTGHYYIEERMMLSCIITRKNSGAHEYTALNDVLVKSRGSRMMEIRAFANGATIDKFRADGLIISTATGSTGYSLAAGGPVVSPRAKVMILNPICPHRLHDRAYVLPEDEVITLEFGEREKDIVVTLDGQTTVSITPEDKVQVQKSSHCTRLIRLNEISSYERLRIKLLSDFES